MPIQFECPYCRTKLELTENLAGRQARCPSCSKAVTIPGPAGTPGPPSPAPKSPIAQPPFQSSAVPPKAPTPQATGIPQANNPYVQPNNPYAQPGNPYAAPYSTTVNTSTPQTLGPAIGMIVGAVLSILVGGLGILGGIMDTAEQTHERDLWEEQLRENDEFPMIQDSDPSETIMTFAMFIGCILISFVTIIGAFAMVKKKAYAMAMIGAVCASIPCQCCFPVAMPFGIWGIVVLANKNVRDQFG